MTVHVVPPRGRNAQSRSKDPQVHYTPEQEKQVAEFQSQSEALLKKYSVKNAGHLEKIESISDSDQVALSFSRGERIARNRDELLTHIKGLAESLRKYGFVDGQDTVQHTLWMLNQGLKACIKNGRSRGRHLVPSDPHADVYRKGYIRWFEDQLRETERKWRSRA